MTTPPVTLSAVPSLAVRIDRARRTKDPVDRIRIADELLDEARAAMTAIGEIRRGAVGDLVEQRGVVATARVLGVSREAVYRALERDPKERSLRRKRPAYVES